jgi:CSLREA domain-containing protein
MSLAGLLVALLPLLVAPAPAAADGATFTVTSMEDESDSNTADGLCNNGAGACTLRAAIQQANTTAGKDTIAFNISGAGPHTIRPTSPLPIITDPVIIDGYTQPGAQPNTNPVGHGLNAVMKIELDGSNAGISVDGLLITGGNSTVRGLVINRFPGTAILIANNGGNMVDGNFIGTDVTGTSARGNLDGVIIISSNNVIGGPTASASNLISGNKDVNQRSAVFFKGSVSDNLLQGNLIGTDLSGVNLLGNFDHGVLVTGSRNRILNNTIASSAGAGVLIHSSSGTGNAILGNSIHSNGGLGIDLGGDGITPNDSGDGDSGANNLQNFPQLISALLTPGDPIGAVFAVTLLRSTPNSQFTLEFFANSVCDPSGNGEGRTFQGNISNITTGSTGNAIVSLTGSSPLPEGTFLTATATDPNGNTSELSPCKVITQGTVSSAVNGVVSLQGRTATFPQGVGNRPARVVLSHPAVNGTTNVTPAGNFVFTNISIQALVELGFPNGNLATFTASAPGYVAARRDNVQVTVGQAISLPSTQLRCGLVNDDIFVNINDITATVASFGKTLTDRVDALGRFVDQNGDSFVNINDITCVVSGFGTTSPLPWP